MEDDSKCKKLLEKARKMGVVTDSDKTETTNSTKKIRDGPLVLECKPVNIPVIPEVQALIDAGLDASCTQVDYFLLTKDKQIQYHKIRSFLIQLKESVMSDTNHENLLGSKLFSDVIMITEVPPVGGKGDVNLKAHFIKKFGEANIELHCYINFTCEPIEMNFEIKQKVESEPDVGGESTIQTLSKYISNYRIWKEERGEPGPDRRRPAIPGKAVFRPFVDPIRYHNRVPKLLEKQYVDNKALRDKRYHNWILFLNQNASGVYGKISIDTPWNIVERVAKTLNIGEIMIFRERFPSIKKDKSDEFRTEWTQYQTRLRKNYDIYLKETLDEPKLDINTFSEIKVVKSATDFLSNYHTDAIMNLASLDSRLKLTYIKEKQQIIINQEKYSRGGGGLEPNMEYIQHLFKSGLKPHETKSLSPEECPRYREIIEGLYDYVPGSLREHYFNENVITQAEPVADGRRAAGPRAAAIVTQVPKIKLHYKTRYFARDGRGDYKLLVDKTVENYYPDASYGYCRPFRIEDVIYSSNIDLITLFGINGANAKFLHEQMEKFKWAMLSIISLYNVAITSYCSHSINSNYNIIDFTFIPSITEPPITRKVFFGEKNEVYELATKGSSAPLNTAKLFVTTTIDAMKIKTGDDARELDSLYKSLKERLKGRFKELLSKLPKNKDRQSFVPREPTELIPLRLVSLIEGDRSKLLEDIKEKIECGTPAEIDKLLRTSSVGVTNYLKELKEIKFEFKESDFPELAKEDNDMDIEAKAEKAAEKARKLGVWGRPSASVTADKTPEQVLAEQESIRKRSEEEAARRFTADVERIRLKREREAAESALVTGKRSPPRTGAATLVSHLGETGFAYPTWVYYETLLKAAFERARGILAARWQSRALNDSLTLMRDSDYNIGLIMLQNPINYQKLMKEFKNICSKNKTYPDSDLSVLCDNVDHPYYRRYVMNGNTNLFAGQFYDILREIATKLIVSGVTLKDVNEQSVFRKKEGQIFEVAEKTITFAPSDSLKRKAGETIARETRESPEALAASRATVLAETRREEEERVSKAAFLEAEAVASGKPYVREAIDEVISPESEVKPIKSSISTETEKARTDEESLNAIKVDRLRTDELRGIKPKWNRIKNINTIRIGELKRKSLGEGDPEKTLLDILEGINTKITEIITAVDGRIGKAGPSPGERRRLGGRGGGSEENEESNYKLKYLKYKQKYLKLKEEMGL
jgi:hypothetical protein